MLAPNSGQYHRWVDKGACAVFGESVIPVWPVLLVFGLMLGMTLFGILLPQFITQRQAAYRLIALLCPASRRRDGSHARVLYSEIGR